MIGARQHQQPTDFYVYTPNSRSVPVVVTLTTQKRGVLALSTFADTIPAGNNIAYFSLAGLVPGRDSIIATATGYQPDTAYVTVTTPQFRSVYIPSTANTTSPPATVALYTADSLDGIHYASDTVTVRAVSSNTNVIIPDSAYFHIPKNLYYAQPKIIYVGAGTATMTYSDSAGSGYKSATSNTVTVTGPSLTISGGNGMLGMRQITSTGQYYIYTPNPVGTDLTVNLLSTSTRVATVPATVTIPAGQQYGAFDISALDTIGTIQIQATASGYSPASVNMQVTKPKFVFSATTSLNTTSGPSTFYVYAADANGTNHYTTENVTVTLASSAPGVASIDSTTVTIPKGQYYATAQWTPVSVGTATLTATDTRSPYYSYAQGSQNVTVQTPQTYVSWGGLSLGLGQYTDNYYVQVPNTSTSARTVPLTHSANPRTSTASSVTIPANSNIVYPRISASSQGADTLTASPAGHVPASGVVTVGLGRIDPLSGWPTQLKVGDSVQVTIYTRGPNQSGYPVSAATTFALAPTNIEFVSGGTTSTVITSVTVAADAQAVTFWMKGKVAGTGSANITNANYNPYSNSLTVIP